MPVKQITTLHAMPVTNTEVCISTGNHDSVMINFFFTQPQRFMNVTARYVGLEVPRYLHIIRKVGRRSGSRMTPQIAKIAFDEVPGTWICIQLYAEPRP